MPQLATCKDNDDAGVVGGVVLRRLDSVFGQHDISPRRSGAQPSRLCDLSKFV